MPSGCSSPSASTSSFDACVSVFKKFDVSRSGCLKGHVSLTLDRDIGRNVYVLKGSVSASNALIVPARLSEDLRIKGKFLYVIMRADSLARTFCFHVDVVLQENIKYRLSFSNLYKEIKVMTNVVQFPVMSLRGRWTIVGLNVSELLLKFTNLSFDHFKRFELCSSMMVKGIYASNQVYSPEFMYREMKLPIPKNQTFASLYDFLWLPAHPATLIQENWMANIRDVNEREKENDPFLSEQCGSGQKLPSIGDIPVADNTSSLVALQSPPKKNISFLDLSSLTSNNNGVYFHKRSFAHIANHTTLDLEHVMGFNQGRNLVFAYSGKEIIFSCSNMIVAQLITQSGVSKQRFFVGHTDTVTLLELSPDGKLVASAQNGPFPQVRIWSFANAETMLTLDVFPRGVTSLHFNLDGTRFCAAGLDSHYRHIIYVWDLKLCGQTYITEVLGKQMSDFSISRLIFLPEKDFPNQICLASCGNENIRFWRVKHGHLPGFSVVLNEHSRLHFKDLIFEPTLNGIVTADAVVARRLFAVTDSGALFQLHFGDRQLECGYQLHTGTINGVRVNEGFCATVSSDGFLRMWPLDFSDYFLEASHEAPVSCLDVSYDGLQIVSGTVSGSIGVLDIANHQYSRVLRSHASLVKTVCCEPHYQMQFTTASVDGSIRIWDFQTYQQLYEFKSVNDFATSLCYQPSSLEAQPATIIAAGFSSGCVRIFDILNSALNCEVQVHIAPVLAVHFSFDGNWIYSVSKSGELCVMDAKQGFTLFRTVPDVFSSIESDELLSSQVSIAYFPPVFEVTATLIIGSIESPFILLVDLTTFTTSRFSVGAGVAKIEFVDATYLPLNFEQSASSRFCIVYTVTGHIFFLHFERGTIGVISHFSYVLEKPLQLVAASCFYSNDALYKVVAFNHDAFLKLVSVPLVGFDLLSVPMLSLSVEDAILDISSTPAIEAKIIKSYLCTSGLLFGIVFTENSLVSLSGECICIWKLGCPFAIAEPNSPILFVDENDETLEDATNKSSNFVAVDQVPTAEETKAEANIMVSPSGARRSSFRPGSMVFGESLLPAGARRKSMSPSFNKTRRASMAKQTVIEVLVPPFRQCQPQQKTHFLDLNYPETRSPLHLDRIIGINAKARSNLIWNGDFLIYSSGSLVVIEALADQSQNYISAHSQSISTLTLSPDKKMLITGSIGDEVYGSNLRVWSLQSALLLFDLYQHTNAIQAVHVDSSSRFLLSIGAAPDNSVAVWDLQNGLLLGSATITASANLFCGLFLNENHIVVAGSKSVSLCRISKGNNIMQVSNLLLTVPIYHPVFSNHTVSNIRGLACVTMSSFTNAATQYSVSSMFVPKPEITAPANGIQFTALDVQVQANLLAVGTTNGLIFFFKYSKDFAFASLVAISDVLTTEIDYLRLDLTNMRITLAGSSTQLYSLQLKIPGSEMFQIPVMSENRTDYVDDHAPVALNWVNNVNDWSHAHFDAGVTSIFMHASALSGVVSTALGSIWFFQYQNGAVKATQLLHSQSGISHVTFSSESDQVFSVCGEGSVRVWQLDAKMFANDCKNAVSHALHFKVLLHSCSCSLFLPNQKKIFRDLESLKINQALPIPTLSPSSLLIAGYNDGTLRVLDVHQMLIVHKIHLEVGIVHVALLYHPSRGNILLAALQDGRCVLINTQTWTSFTYVNKHAGTRIVSLDVSRKNPEVWLILDSDSCVSIWTLLDNVKHDKLCAMVQFVHLIAVSEELNEKTVSAPQPIFAAFSIQAKLLLFTSPNSMDLFSFDYGTQKVRRVASLSHVGHLLAVSGNGKFVAVGAPNSPFFSIVSLDTAEVNLHKLAYQQVMSLAFNESNSRLIVGSSQDISVFSLHE